MEVLHDHVSRITPGRCVNLFIRLFFLSFTQTFRESITSAQNLQTSSFGRERKNIRHVAETNALVAVQKKGVFEDAGRKENGMCRAGKRVNPSSWQDIELRLRTGEAVQEFLLPRTKRTWDRKKEEEEKGGGGEGYKEGFWVE